MNKNFTRFMGILLAILMIVTMVPMNAFASNTTGATATGSPNVFSVVADATGNQQTEYLLADTLEQDGETYYGLMLRKNINIWYGDLKLGGTSLKPMDDTSKTSTDTTIYKKYQYHTNGASYTDVDNLLDDVYPEAVQPYAQNLEIQIATDINNANVKYYATGKMFPPLAATVDENKDYMSLPIENNNFRGLITRSPSGWRGNWYYFASKYQNSDTGDYSTGYAELGAANYNYYWTSVIYVTKDFFKNIKIDTTKEVGENVKAFMSANLTDIDVFKVGYTAEELAVLGIKECPDNADTAIDWSPNYAKLAGLDLLFNGTMDKDGTTYYGFTWAKDFGGRSDNTLPSAIEFYNATDADTGNVVGYDGEVLPNKNYGQILISTGNRTRLGTIDDYILPQMPVELTNYMLKYDWPTGKYGMLNAQEYVVAESYLRGKLSIPSKDELTPHIPYLTSLINDNVNYSRDEWSGKTATSRTSSGAYTLYIYDTVSASWKTGPTDRWISASSTFPTFYLSEDALKAVKIDVVSMGENVKALFPANFVRSDLEGLYTDDELDALGVTDTPANIKPEHSSKYVKLSDGTKLFYIGSEEVGGKKYANFFMIKEYAGTNEVEGIVWKKDAEDPNGVALDNSQYGEYYLSTGTVNTSSGVSLDATVIPDLPAALKNNLLLKEWVAGFQYPLNGSGNGAAKSKTYITLPSRDEILEFGPYIKSMIMDNTNGKSTTSQSSSSKAAVIRTAGAYSQQTYDAEANAVTGLPSGIEYSAGSVFPVFAVDVDFLKDIKVDVTSIGADVRAMIANNFIKSDFNVAYTDEEFEALGVKDRLVIPPGPEGSTFVVDGKTFILMESTKEINGKNYYGVIEQAGMKHNNNYGAIKYTLDAEKTNETTTYVSIQGISPWGDVWPNGKGTFDIQTETEASFAPLASYLLERDWTIHSSWNWNNAETATVLAVSGKIGLPTEAQYKQAIEDGDLTISVPAYALDGLHNYAVHNYTYYEKVNSSGNADTNLRATMTASDTALTWSGGSIGGSFFFMGYVSEDFFKETKLDLATMSSGVRNMLTSNFDVSDLLGLYTEEELKAIGFGDSVQPEEPDEPITVSGVTLDKTSLKMYVDDVESLSAKIIPDGVEITSAVWSSSNGEVVSIYDYGTPRPTCRINAYSAGTATITLTVDGKYTATCYVTVEERPRPVDNVVLDKSAVSMYVGDVETLKATVYPTLATNKNVVWTSSNEKVATVDENGVVTANGEGTATITVTTEDGGFAATCEVTVSVYVEIPVNFDKVTYEIVNGEVTITGCDTTITGELVIPETIDGNPVTKIGNKAFNECRTLESIVLPESIKTIGTQAFYNCYALTSINIPEGVTSIGSYAFFYCKTLPSIDLPEGITTIGKYTFGYCRKLTSIEIPEGVKSITANAFLWCDKLATVYLPKSLTSIGASAFADCKALKVVNYGGTEEDWANIVIGAKNDKLTGATINFAKISVEGVALDATAAELYVGDTATLTATVTPENAEDKSVIWTSSNDAVATVVDGVVTAVGVGTATITVTTVDGGYTATCEVTVAEEIIVDKTPEFVLGNVKTLGGRTERISVEIKNNPGIVSAFLKVYYDNHFLKLVGVEDKDVLGEDNHSANYYGNPYILSWENDTAEVALTGNGVIVDLIFEVAVDAPVGVYDVEITYTEILDKDIEFVEFDIVNGTIEVLDDVMGDVNGDGVVNTKDRVILSRHLAGWLGYEDIEELTSDVDCNNVIDTKDRMILARFLGCWEGYESLPYINK